MFYQIFTLMLNYNRVFGYPDGIALRHTSALDALDEGISLEKVQRQLGHANIKTTMGYLRGRDEDRARAYRNQSLSAGLSERADERRNQTF